MVVHVVSLLKSKLFPTLYGGCTIGKKQPTTKKKNNNSFSLKKEGYPPLHHRLIHRGFTYFNPGQQMHFLLCDSLNTLKKNYWNHISRNTNLRALPN